MKALMMLALVSAAAVADQPRIEWQEWSSTAFEAAKKLDRPMLINVGHEGCSACRWMEVNTFSDPAIVALVNANFVAVQVDSEMRPDIGERYSDWAWPATAFNRPDGTQVLAIRGSRGPEKFATLLNEVLDGHRAGSLEADRLAPYAAPTALRDSPLTDIRDQVRGQLDRSFDDERGGWGRAKVLEHAEPIVQYALRAHLEGDDQAQRRFLQTAEGFLGHLDPVWGGMFYASFGSWDRVVAEKRLESQAAGLQLFAAAHKLTGEPRFAAALASINEYLQAHLSSQDGLFFGSHQANLPGLPQDMSLRDYYALDDAGRRAIGVPTIDRSVFTDLNARVISGLVSAFETTGREAFLTTALTAAQALLKTRKAEAGHFIQFAPGDEFRAEERVHAVEANDGVFLRPHGYLGLAFLDLHRATADERWLLEARGIARVLRQLQDPELGGFFGATGQPMARKPLEDNAVAARFFYLLGVLEQNNDYRAAGERAVRASAARPIVRREGRITGNLGLTTELLTAGYVEFSIVGDPQDPAAQKLFEAGRDVFEPRKLLHYERPGRYPVRDRPAMYICNDQAWSVPIFEADQVAGEAQWFVDALRAAEGPEAS